MLKEVSSVAILVTYYPRFMPILVGYFPSSCVSWQLDFGGPYGTCSTFLRPLGLYPTVDQGPTNSHTYLASPAVVVKFPFQREIFSYHLLQCFTLVGVS